MDTSKIDRYDKMTGKVNKDRKAMIKANNDQPTTNKRLYDISKVKKYSNVRIKASIIDELKALKYTLKSKKTPSMSKVIEILINNAKSTILKDPNKKSKFYNDLNKIDAGVIQNEKRKNSL